MTTEVDHLANSVSWQLSGYEIDGDRGFLPAPDPADRLPNEFSPWEEMGRELPKLLMSGKSSEFHNRHAPSRCHATARRS